MTDIPAAPLSYTKRGTVAWLQLCSPASGNCLTPDMDKEIAAFCTSAEEDEQVSLFILAGSADVFCRGLDYVTEDGTSAAQAIRAQFGALHSPKALGAITKPTLAAINGDALGVGLEMALACDLRVSITRAHFGFPQIADGLVPFGGGTQRLPRIVGQAKALALVLTGELIDATEAQRIGLVSEAIPESTFATRIDEIIQGLLGKGPIALRLGKEAVHKAMDLTLDQGMRLEEDLYALLQTTCDRAEGVQAFLAKRQPTFTGQ
jgi:enoyl-CoA hydratase/carnithine racemase